MQEEENKNHTDRLISENFCIYSKIDIIDEFFSKRHKKTGRPAGWHWMSEFVDKDGTVFHKGKEQPDLKGTLKSTKMKPLKKRKKLTPDEKLQRDIKRWNKRKKARRAK